MEPAEAVDHLLRVVDAAEAVAEVVAAVFLVARTASRMEIAPKSRRKTATQLKEFSHRKPRPKATPQPRKRVVQSLRSLLKPLSLLPQLVRS